MKVEEINKVYECCKDSFHRHCDGCPVTDDCCHDKMPLFVLKYAIELIEDEEELGEELGRAVELIRKKDARIKKLLKKQPHWIPISERKPKGNGVYIVSRWVSDGCAKKMLSDVAYFDGTDTWYDDYETVYDPDRIVAWLPLPEPYRTDT